MNNRIRELALQAIANVRFWDAEKESYDVGHDELEKFAKLIVRECASLCEREGQNPFNNVWEKTRAKCDALMIREHFGVEE